MESLLNLHPLDSSPRPHPLRPMTLREKLQSVYTRATTFGFPARKKCIQNDVNGKPIVSSTYSWAGISHRRLANTCLRHRGRRTLKLHLNTGEEVDAQDDRRGIGSFPALEELCGWVEVDRRAGRGESF